MTVVRQGHLRYSVRRVWPSSARGLRGALGGCGALSGKHTYHCLAELGSLLQAVASAASFSPFPICLAELGSLDLLQSLLSDD